MMLAVLEKRAGFKLGAKDVFLNIAGGISVNDPAIDLAVIVAILSSNQDKAIPQNYCFAAEVGLAGEIRPVNRIEQRILEAEKLGFEAILVSKFAKVNTSKHKITILKTSRVEDVIKALF
jgi:DNA repair protein RadA/Sms